MRLDRQTLVIALSTGVAVFLAAFLSWGWALEGGVVSVWLPSGVTLGILLQTDRRGWMGVLLGAYLGNLGADLMQVDRLWLAMAGPAVNVVESLVAALILCRLGGSRNLLASVRGVGIFILGGVVLSNGLTALLGGGLLSLAFETPFEELWLAWWLGDGLGMLVMAPAVLGTLSWIRSLPSLPSPRRTSMEALLILGGLLSVILVAYNRPGQLDPFLAVVVFPFFILSAVRLKMGAHLATGLTALAVLWFSAQGMGPLVQAGLPSLNQALQLFAFLAIASISVLVLVATELEREAAQAAEERLHDRLLQAQKMEAIGRLTGGIAHDFNNMLTVIMGQTELASAEAAPGDPILQQLNGIRDAAERSAGLTRQLLGFARQQPASPRILDLNEALTGLMGLLRKLIREEIALEWRPGSDLWKVSIDPVQLQQIMMNLYGNARDAIAGAGTIVLETGKAAFDAAYCAQHPGFMEGEYAQLSVTDDGVGMAPESLAQVFEPFFTTKMLGRGTGLGLATVYGIVKQNRGFVSIYSEPELGTTIKIYLPRQSDGEDAVPVSHAPTGKTSGNESVLMVDDEERILGIAAAALRRKGYQVLTASAPEAALALGKEHRIDILVTDVVMPKMDGRALAERLLETHSGLRVLFTSGYTSNVIAHRGILEEGVHFIAKPYTPEALAEKVRTLLDDPAAP